MTTAAKPTYVPARGGTGKSENDLGALSKQYSSRDLPAHTKLKYRQDGQGTSSDLKNRDFRKELEEKERSGRDKGGRGDRRGESSSSLAIGNSSKKPRLEVPIANLDADDPQDEDEDENEDGGESDDDEDDNTAALLAELQKIKKERAADTARKEQERKAEEDRIRVENIVKGNPLINNAEKTALVEFKVKRRWDDDVVFKNCARGDGEKKDRRFINDTLRSEFHKKFMEKYIK